VSRRYAVKGRTFDFYVPDWRSAPTNGAKQGSDDFMTELVTNDLDRAYSRVALDAVDTYNMLLTGGCCPRAGPGFVPHSRHFTPSGGGQEVLPHTPACTHYAQTCMLNGKYGNTQNAIYLRLDRYSPLCRGRLFAHP
jgi:hypothetical protein